MDLPTLANAPRFVTFGDDADLHAFMVESISMKGMAIVLAWLDDVLPGRAERKMPPPFNSEESQRALVSGPGRKLLTYVALRDQGVTYAGACAIASVTTDVQFVRLCDVLYGHRRTMVPSDDGKDIAETWFGKGAAALVQSIGFAEMLDMSMDQFEWLMRDGDTEDENPAYSREKLTEVVENFEAKWGDKLRALAAKAEPDS